MLRYASPNRMGLQRYDVLDPSTGTFVPKTWLPVNSPIFDADGNTVAILHHVEDVSHLVTTTSLEQLLSTPTDPASTDARDLADARRFAERARRDAQSRRQRADALFARSVEAMDRPARRMSAARVSSIGPARQQINGYRRLGH